MHRQSLKKITTNEYEMRTGYYGQACKTYACAHVCARVSMRVCMCACMRAYRPACKCVYVCKYLIITIPKYHEVNY